MDRFIDTILFHVQQVNFFTHNTKNDPLSGMFKKYDCLIECPAAVRGEGRRMPIINSRVT